MRVGSTVLATMVAAAVGSAACGGSSPPTRHAEKSRSVAREQEAPPAARPGVAWSAQRVRRVLAHAVVRVHGRRVRIDRSTLTCDGEGAGTRHGSRMAWTRFTCIQPTFGGSQVAGPDAVFVVEPTGPRTMRISAARFTRY